MFGPSHTTVEHARRMHARTHRSNPRRLVRIAGLLAVVVLAPGCATWHATDQTPREVVATNRPQKVRVTTGDGATTVLQRPRVLGEVLAGFEESCVSRWGFNETRCPETGVPVFEISTLEVHRRGIGSLLLPAAGGLLTAWLLANR